ncbi:hypothetical protein F5Y12DRAFT_324333 [Xylaria sp. FL1777]|nr:hypothetical protein F5Y12DRAFT_324333 [Xylaria sp. FL1777]
MSSPTGFPIFNKLPTELRVSIWKISILEYNRDRLVPINENTKRIICIRNIACSPHFSVSSESREVAKGLYPVRLPVSWLEGGQRIANEDAEVVDDYSRQWAIYISTELDIFVLSLDRLAPSYMSEYYSLTAPFGGRANFGWRSASLTPLQCQSVRRVMLFDFIDVSRLKKGCRGRPYCVVRCGAMDYNKGHDRKIFSGVQRCLYAVQDLEFTESFMLYRDMLNSPGHKFLEDLARTNCLVWLDEADMNEHEEKGTALECLCR